MSTATPLRKPEAPKDDDEKPNLAQALKAAKKAVEPITKERKGARGKYAPLDIVLDVVEPVLDAHDCLLTQPTVIDKEIGQLIVRTTIEHVRTGESKVAEWPAGNINRRTLTKVTDDGVVFTVEQEPTMHQQELGGGATYGRRYSLLALLGIQPEDEDDDAGHGRGQSNRSSPMPRRDAAPARDKKTDEEIAKFVAQMTTGLLNCDNEEEVEAFWKTRAEKIARLTTIDPDTVKRLETMKAKRIVDLNGEVYDA